MKYVMTFPIEKKKDIMADLILMKQDLEKASKKMKLFAKAYNKAMHMDSDAPMFSVTWKEIEDDKIEILFLTAVAPMINPAKIDNAFFKIAKDYEATIEKIVDEHDVTGSMFKSDKKEK